MADEKISCGQQKAKAKDQFTSLGKRKRRPPRSYSSSSSDEEDIIQQSIETKAARNHLTVNNVRNIIKNVVSNARVVAAVQSRAEELERRVEDCKERIAEGILAESPDGKRMTRNRSRQLNRSSIPIADLSAVVQSHLPSTFFDSESDAFSNDEDIEYQPNYNEADSEDEYSTATCSDIDSQPCTPATAMDEQEGVFKRPLQRDTPIKKPSSDNRSTRSKISLTGTPIEDLQSPFIPPDAIEDPAEGIPDQPWEDFLEQFQKPLNTVPDGEDGEETDPEYVYNAALDHLDPTGDSINVPKREVDILLKELFDEVEDQVDSTYAIEFEEPSLHAPLSIPSHDHPPQTTTKVPKEEILDTREEQGTPPMVQFPPGVDPLATLLPHPPLQPNFNLIQGSDNQLYLLPVCNPVPIRSHILSPSDQKTKPKTAYLEINVNDDWETILGQINSQKIAQYQYELDEARVIDGWTPKALRIFHRQLLTHIQLVGQNFVQSFSHPFLWDDAWQFMEILDDLKQIASQNSLLQALCWNIHDMHAICKEWEAELTVESEENQDYVRALTTGEWHPRVMERFVTHRAFIFQELLPTRAAQKRIDHLCLKMLPRRVLFILHLEEKQFRKTSNVKWRHVTNEFKEKYGETKGECAYYGLLKSPQVKEYLRTGRVPDIPHKEMDDILSYDDVIRHADKSFQTLPTVWHNYMNSVKRSKLIPRVSKPVQIEENISRKDLVGSREATVTMNFANFQAQFQLPNTPVYYGIGEDVPESEDEEHEISADEGVCVIEADPSNQETKRRRVRKRSDKVRRKKWTAMAMIKKSLEMQKSSGKNRPCKALLRIRERKQKCYQLYHMLTALDRKYDENLELLDANSIPTKLFNYLKEFDIYVQLMFARMSQKRNRKEKRVPLQRVDEKYLLLFSDNRDPGPTEVCKDTFFAWKYLKTVQTGLKCNFKHFLAQIPNAGDKCSVFKFYARIEQLFIPEFKELLKMFLVHVLPRHVGQLGTFFEELVYQDADALQSNLSLYMRRRRKQMERIFDLLNELAQEENMTGMISIKQRFIAILRGNPLILQWFLQLFPTDRSSPTAHDSHASMQFSELGNGIILPGDLISAMSSMVREELPIPPLKLYLSDTDDESDSVIFVREDQEPPMEQFSNSMHSIASRCSQDTEGSFGIREEELMPHVSGGQMPNDESSFECYDDDSEVYVTDYTE